MLSNLLFESVKELEDYNRLVELANDNKAKEQIGKKFNVLNVEFGNLLSEIDIINEKTDFVISDQAVNDIKRFIEGVDKVIYRKTGSENINQQLQKDKNSVEEQVKYEWSIYYSDRSSKLINTLQIVMDITPNKEYTNQITNRIEKGKSWPIIEKNIDYFISGLQDAEKTIYELNLDDKITQFLMNVGNGKVTLLNITDEILLWINTNNISGLFKVSFVRESEG